MDINPELASSLGFPKLQYTAVERERRWLCRAVPRELVLRTERITDLYVTGARLRLREARPLSGEAPLLRLTRKADVDPRTRLITSIYLPENEFQILSKSLSGKRIHKLRHRLAPQPGAILLIDEFQGPLAGLIVAEVEFKTAELMTSFPSPVFTAREITDDLRFTGGSLVNLGLPDDLPKLTA